MMNCPRCHSEHIRRSKRKGIIERRILALLFVRPFRCESCNLRFFRWSFTTNPNAARTATTIGNYSSRSSE
jgi:transposase-like protein